MSRADPLLPKREGRALLGDVGDAVEGPDVGPHHQPRRPQQNQIPGRIRQVHGIPAVAVPADEEPPFALQHEDGDEVDRPGAVAMRRDAQATGRVAVQGAAVEAERSREGVGREQCQPVIQERLEGFPKRLGSRCPAGMTSPPRSAAGLRTAPRPPAPR